MPIYRLDEDLVFPPVEMAEDGLLAVGGDLRPERLLLAYSRGIFPWYGENLPILWHSPALRMVMAPTDLVVQRSLRKALRKRPYELRMDTAFSQVLAGCAAVPRPRQHGTWLIPEMIEAYTHMHKLGLAHSIEAWNGDVLVGGLYGVSLGGAFFGESMFSRAPDASKIAFVATVHQLEAWGIRLIDCQVHTDHLQRFGAFEVPRAEYLTQLALALKRPTRRGMWQFDIDLDALAAAGGVMAVGGPPDDGRGATTAAALGPRSGSR
jgi:leucyl/phenylalanyl-tRNA--protein transferase